MLNKQIILLQNAGDDDTEWAVDVSEEAVRARMQDLTDGAKNMTINDDLEKTEKERMDLLYNLVKTKKEADLLDSALAQKELLNEAERLEIKTKAPLILAELLYDQNIFSQAKKHRMLMLRFTHDDKKAQKYLIGGLEQVIDLHKSTLMAKIPMLLKLFYDLDILSEAAIIEWADKVCNNLNFFIYMLFNALNFFRYQKNMYQKKCPKRFILKLHLL